MDAEQVAPVEATPRPREALVKQLCPAQMCRGQPAAPAQRPARRARSAVVCQRAVVGQDSGAGAGPSSRYCSSCLGQVAQFDSVKVSEKLLSSVLSWAGLAEVRGARGAKSRASGPIRGPASPRLEAAPHHRAQPSCRRRAKTAPPMTAWQPQVQGVGSRMLLTQYHVAGPICGFVAVATSWKTVNL